MVPIFKSKTLITNLYSMNPPNSRGYYFFTTLYMPLNSVVDGMKSARPHFLQYSTSPYQFQILCCHEHFHFGHAISFDSVPCSAVSESAESKMTGGSGLLR
jgi:hypothetical protein